MKICKSLATDYKSINVSETETLWSADATYAYGAEVRCGHYIYKYAGEDNTNTENKPSLEWAKDKETYPIWVQLRPTNYWGALDIKTSNQTIKSSPLVMEFQNDNYDSVSLLNVEAGDIKIEIIKESDNTVVFMQEFNMRDESNVIDFFSYCFEPFVFSPSIYSDSLYVFGSDTFIRITVSGLTTVAVGRVVIGRSFYVGETEWGVNSSILSFSGKSTDVFGNTTLVQRGKVNTDTASVKIPTSKVETIRDKFGEVDATPILFILDESKDSVVNNLLNFGYWETFSVMIPNPVKSTVSVGIKGIL